MQAHLPFRFNRLQAQENEWKCKGRLFGITIKYHPLLEKVPEMNVYILFIYF